MGRKPERRKRPGSREANTETRLLKALGHPVRREIFGLLDGQSASPKELAERLGVNLSYLSYHVRALHEAGLIEVTRKRQRRGAEQTFYKARRTALLGHGVLKRLLGLGESELGDAVEDLVARLEETSARPERSAEPQAVSATLQLDEEGWAYLKQFAEEIRVRALQIEDEASRRCLQEEGRQLSVRASFACFLYALEEPPPEADED